MNLIYDVVYAEGHATRIDIAETADGSHLELIIDQDDEPDPTALMLDETAARNLRRVIQKWERERAKRELQ